MKEDGYRYLDSLSSSDLLLLALIHDIARWIPYYSSSGTGELSVNGMRYSMEFNERGLLDIDSRMREVLLDALAASPTTRDLGYEA